MITCIETIGMACQTARCLRTKPHPYRLFPGFLNDTMHFSCYTYMYLHPVPLLCDVASRILIADIIYRNSVFSSLHFIGCTTTLELWAASNTGLLLTVHLYEVPSFLVFTSALMVCSTKYGYTTTDGTKRLVQIQAGVSNQQLTVLHKWMLALQIQYK